MQRDTLAVVGHIGPVARGDKMSVPHALAALAALGQPSRLEISGFSCGVSPMACQPG